MAYTQTDQVVAGSTAVIASQYNDLRAELKAAALGLYLSSNMTLTYAYNADGTVNTVTAVDGDGDANTDCDYVTTYSYNANSTVATAVTVFDKLGITMTETYSWTGFVLNSVAVTFA